MEYRFDEFRLLPEIRELWKGERQLAAPRLVFDCLHYLIKCRDRAVDRDELVSAVWGRVDVAEARVAELVLRARRAVGDDGQAQNFIKTVPGFGYRWVKELEVYDSSAADNHSNESIGDARLRSDPEGLTGVEDERRESSAADRPVEDQSDEPNAATQEGLRQPPSSDRRSALPRWPLLVAGTVLVLLAISYVLSRLEKLPLSAIDEVINTVMVAPIEVDGPSDAAWLRLGAMVLIADRLRNAGLPVLPSETVLPALAAHGADASTLNIDALSPKLNVGLLIRGQAVKTEAGWALSLRSIDIGGHRRQVRAVAQDILIAAGEATDKLLLALGETPAQERVSQPDTVQEILQRAHVEEMVGNLDKAELILAEVPEGRSNDPRVQLQRARLSHLAGGLDKAVQTYTDLIAGIDRQHNPLLYGRALSGRAASYFRDREFVAAERDFSDAIAILRGLNVPNELGKALSGRGGARIATRDFGPASADLGQARIQLQQAGDEPELAQIDLYTGVLENYRFRPELALLHLTRALDTFDAFGMIERAQATTIGLMDSQITLLRWRDALATSDRQQGLLREYEGDPMLPIIANSRRGVVLIALGQFSEATDLFNRTNTLFADVRVGPRRYLHAFEADLAWAQKNYRRTIDAVDNALDTWPSDPAYDRRGQLILMRQRALVAAGLASAELVEPLHESETDQTVSLYLNLARAEWAAEQGRNRTADSFYESALAVAQERGLSSYIAAVASSYGQWLLTQDRLDRASTLAGLVSPWADVDYECALLQLRVQHRYGRREPWAQALHQVRALAGEREVPADVEQL